MITERVEAWARQGISTDITTAILRSEGYADEEIRAAYDELLAAGATVEVTRTIPTITI